MSQLLQILWTSDSKRNLDRKSSRRRAFIRYPAPTPPLPSSRWVYKQCCGGSGSRKRHRKQQTKERVSTNRIRPCQTTFRTLCSTMVEEGSAIERPVMRSWSALVPFSCPSWRQVATKTYRRRPRLSHGIRAMHLFSILSSDCAGELLLISCLEMNVVVVVVVVL